jgi:hypothetical protein
VAVDNNQQSATADITVTVVANVPPTVELIQPSDGAAFQTGDNITAAARASDVNLNGGIDRVEFFLKEMDRFDNPITLVGTAKGNFVVSFKVSNAGHYMLWAVATNKGGTSSQSIPIHLEVGPHANH